jgi:chorismate--pyruvate lyase
MTSVSSLGRWLRREGSLSAHVQTLGGTFAVQRLGQCVAPLLPGEARSLGVAAHTRCVVREVVLRVDGRPLVFARSLAPARSLAGPWRSLGALGNRPLAQLLFDSPLVRRGPLTAFRAGAEEDWFRHVDKRWQQATGEAWAKGAAWGRYSIFLKAGVPLRVTEVFAPEIARLPCPPEFQRGAMRSFSGGSPATSASSRSPASTAATPSGVPV